MARRQGRRLPLLTSLHKRTEGRTLAELAAASGYHDQAHLGRDCRSLTGLAPSAFLAGHDRTFPEMSDPY